MAGLTNSTSDCGFNAYYNGSMCIVCQIGFYGRNCADRCASGLYGSLCSKECECSAESCDFVSGCQSDVISRSNFYNGSAEHFSTISFTSDNEESSNTVVTAGDEISTASYNPEFPSSNSPKSPNILVLIAAIGGLIALFLLVLVVLSFVKLYVKRKERTTQIASKVNSVQQEDTYEAIDESLLPLGVNETNEHRHRKYYQLKNSNPELPLPYQQMRNQYQEIDENCHSSNSSDSNKSFESYLDPKSNVSVPHYVEVLDTNNSKETTIIEGSERGNDPSTQYIEPIHDVRLPATRHDRDHVNNSAYLDVINETVL